VEFGIDAFGFDVFGGFRDKVDGSIRLFGGEPVSEGFEAFFLGDGGTGAALWTVRGEDVLEAGHGLGLGEGGLEEIGEEIAFLKGFGDGKPAGIEFGELDEAVADVGDGDFVKFPGDLLPVSGDEGNGATFGDEFGSGRDLGGTEFEFSGDAGDVFRIHGRGQKDAARRGTAALADLPGACKGRRNSLPA